MIKLYGDYSFIASKAGERSLIEGEVIITKVNGLKLYVIKKE